MAQVQNSIYYNHIYVILLNKNDDVPGLISQSQTVLNQQVHIRDISSSSSEQQNELIRAFLLAIKRKKVSRENRAFMKIMLFQTAPKTYFCIVAIAEYMENPNRMISDLFPSKSIQEFTSTAIPRKGTFESQGFWKSKMMPTPAPLFKLSHKERQYETLNLNLSQETVSLLQKIQNSFHVDLHSLFLTVWAILFKKFFRIDAVALGHFTEADQTIVPILLKTDQPLSVLLWRASQDIAEAGTYAGLNLTQTRNDIFGFSTEQCLPLVQSYCSRSDLETPLQNLTSHTILHIAPFHLHNMSAVVSYLMTPSFCKVQYDYDMLSYSEAEILQLHHDFSQLLTDVLAALHNRIESVSFSFNPERTGEHKKVIENRKVSILKSCKIFQDYTDKQLSDLAQLCSLQNRLQEESILDIGEACHSFYIVENGNLEEIICNSMSYECALRILKAGDLVNIEGLTGSGLSTRTRRVCSQEANLLSIPISVLKTECLSHPSLMFQLLEMQNQEILRYQRLWINE